MTTIGPAPTLEQLRAKYDQERPHRPHWPATFEQAQAHPLVSRTLALLCRTAAAPDRRSPRALTAAERAAARALGSVRPVPLPTPADPPRQPYRTRQLAPGEVDRRRAASGDDPSKDGDE
jgi:hypothetical protein